MSNKNTGFEERLARIAQNQEASGTPAPQDPLQGMKSDRPQGPSRLPRLLNSLVTVVVVLAALVGYMILSSEENVIASMKATAEAELDGRTTLGTLFSSANDSMSDFALKRANSEAAEIIQARIDSGEWTPEQAERALAQVKAREGKSSADMLRDGMRPMIIFEAKNAGHTALGEEYAAKMDSCKSMECVEVVNTQFAIALRAAQGG